MATIAPPSITALPSPPDPANRATFNTLAYPWSAALPTFSTEVSAVAANVKANADDAATSSTTATTKAAEAVAAASAATTAANASAWVNGGTYALNANAISGVDFQTYRKKTASSVTTTDPSADSTNWVGLGGLPAQSGNSGKYLKTDGSVASWSVVPAGLTLLATLTPTAAANVDFLSTFSSTYDNYLIIGQGLKPATTTRLLLRLANAGTVDSASSYFDTPNNGSLAASDTTNYVSALDTLAAGKGLNFSAQVINVNSASSVKFILSDCITNKDATPTYSHRSLQTAYIGAAVSGFRLYWDSGSNFSATGTVRVYGYANT